MTDEPFTMEAKLCDDDGIVRGGAMHHGTDYTCTGHAHYAGEHIKCVSPAHPDGLPPGLYEALIGTSVPLIIDGVEHVAPAHPPRVRLTGR